MAGSLFSLGLLVCCMSHRFSDFLVSSRCYLSCLPWFSARDDRLISAHAREARHPYLDEEFCAFIRALPLSVIVDPCKHLGIGDKQILRQVSRHDDIDKRNRQSRHGILFHEHHLISAPAQTARAIVLFSCLLSSSFFALSLLTQAARLIGLTHTSSLQKRAMQFGTRIANNRVAGYVKFDPSVNLRDIVCQKYLADTIDSDSAGEEEENQDEDEDDEERKPQQPRENGRRHAKLQRKPPKLEHQRRPGEEQHHSSSSCVASFSSASASCSPSIESAPSHSVSPFLDKRVNKKLGKPGYHDP